jgi:meso-butanediol dehydrogenase / (S,S)-butanediol dehydrogenase / diacetyl reductase
MLLGDARGVAGARHTLSTSCTAHSVEQARRAAVATPATTADRSAVVTGAARGIGRAIALRLARDGLDITVNDLPGTRAELDGLVEDVEALGRRGVAAVGDVGVEADVDGLVRTHVEVHGGLDVMVANAGVAITAPLLDTTAEQWATTMRVNVGVSSTATGPPRVR